jgi:quinol monooxygenase YgiN
MFETGLRQMKLVAMQCRFSEANVKPALVLLESLKEQAVLMAGCEGYDVYSANDGAVVVIQRWTTMAEFDGYRKSEAFATIVKDLKPMMSAPPVTTVGEVSG